MNKIIGCDGNLSACNLSFISNQQYAWYATRAITTRQHGNKNRQNKYWFMFGKAPTQMSHATNMGNIPLLVK